MTPVLLRNGQRAVVLGPVSVPPFTCQGVAEGYPELWKANGAWREDEHEHPLDIIATVTPCGQLMPLRKENAK